MRKELIYVYDSDFYWYSIDSEFHWYDIDVSNQPKVSFILID